MAKAPMKTRLVYLACGLVVVVTAIAIAAVVGSSGGADTPASGSPAGEPQAQAQVLIEDELVRITYEGSEAISGLDGMAYAYFRVENLSGQEFTVYPMDSYANDTVVLLTSGVPATIAAGKSYVYPWSLSYAGIGIESYEALEELETKFWLVADDGSTLETVGPFTVEFTQEAE